MDSYIVVMPSSFRHTVRRSCKVSHNFSTRPVLSPFEAPAQSPVFPFGCEICVFKQAGKGGIANLDVFALDLNQGVKLSQVNYIDSKGY